MKVIEPKVEIWEQPKGIEGIYKQIERVGRVCYKSEDRITEGSAKPFVERMIASKHYAMLEHGTVYLSIPYNDKTELLIDELFTNRFTKTFHDIRNGSYHFSTNLRVLVENDMWDVCKQYVCDFFDKGFFSGDRRVTVHFTTQIAVSREANRHRADSMAEQSTRYCNYSKDKFGGEIGINTPTWINDILDMDGDTIDSYAGSDSLSGAQRFFRDSYHFMAVAKKVYDGKASDIQNWIFANFAAERAYMNLIKNGISPQEARVILPLDTNTELVHTAFVSDWLHFFDLRALNKTGKAHPDMIVVAKPLYEEFKRRGYLEYHNM